MPDLLRSVWDEPRPPGPARVPVWRDRVLVAAVMAVAVLEALLRPDLPWRFFAAFVVVAIAPVLFWRRSRPLLAVAIAFGACGLAPLVTGADIGLNTAVFVLILPYALGRWGAAREVAAGFAIMTAKLASSVLLGYIGLGEGVFGLALLFAAVSLGAAVRYRAGVRTRELAQAKLLERERLARDLHDTVAHHVSAIAIRAQAGLATSSADPAAAVEALRVIEAEATRALGEMRTMVRALRRADEDASRPVDLAPTPGVRDLERLAGRGRGGPVVDVEILGDLDDLSPAVGSAVYRLAQESITNARRHARHATRIAVRVAADETSVRLRVSDDGDGHPRAAGSAGYGLVGMAERAGLLGGTCDAGPNPDRGWTVTAVLPRTGTTA
jgi:signal transduction histidine kinase